MRNTKSTKCQAARSAYLAVATAHEPAPRSRYTSVADFVRPPKVHKASMELKVFVQALREKELHYLKVPVVVVSDKPLLPDRPRVEVISIDATTGKPLCVVTGSPAIVDLCQLVAAKVGSLMQ